MGYEKNATRVPKQLENFQKKNRFFSKISKICGNIPSSGPRWQAIFSTSRDMNNRHLVESEVGHPFDRRGDKHVRQQFAAELLRCQEKLRTYVACLVFDKSVVSDIVQEINIIALEKENVYDVDRDFWQWVSAIVTWIPVFFCYTGFRQGVGGCVGVVLFSVKKYNVKQP